MSTVLEVITEWSRGRPDWQRDALRLLLTKKALADSDIADLTSICKGTRGLAEPRTLCPLTRDHVASTGAEADSTFLISVTHHSGVNALAPEQTVRFGHNLTVVYGQNAAGKSGFTRILKRACRSRGREDVLGNVLIDDRPRLPSATIRYKSGLLESSSQWNYQSDAASPLAGVSVFDSQCAPVYVRDKTDVAFRPFGLDIFDKLSALCDQVRARLEQEQRQVLGAMPKEPELPANTRARALVETLTGLTKSEDVKRLATLTEAESERLAELTSLARNLKASDPKQRALELTLRAKRLQVLFENMKTLQKLLGDSGLAALQAALDQVRAEREANTAIREATFSESLLPGTGDEVWLNLWKAANIFSGEAYPNQAFPVTTGNALCLLCQQALATEASTRLIAFGKFVASQAQASLRNAELLLHILMSRFEEGGEPNGLNLALEELSAEDPACAEQVKHFYSEAGRARAAALSGESLASRKPMGRDLLEKVAALIERLQKTASELNSGVHDLSKADSEEATELKARALLAENLPLILDIIDRKQRLAAYGQCIDDTGTTAITRKSTELTKALVTEQLKVAFRDELEKLSFTNLPLDIQSAGGTKGSLFHRIVFSSGPGVAVSSVLSEGESRALSLAAFLAELSTSANQSTIIFDDPVSSLDHIWREKIAARLAAEAAVRQVIVFTHDIVFLRALADESSRLNVSTEHQYIRRESQPGLCSADLPWVAMRVKERIAKLHKSWQEADALYRAGLSEDYERQGREIYARTREAWEQGVVEVLLNDVVERFRPSIETQRLRDLYDITAADCSVVEQAMTECSRWMLGHDHAAAEATPFPAPSQNQETLG
jgi:ABC-type cobalamin/Fe3+-siderophores transport system ATPase subunit